MEERVKHLFGVSIEERIAAADTLSNAIAQAASRLVKCLLNESKILVCGTGGSAANGLHFSTAMINRFDAERPALPVLALATDPALTTAMLTDGQVEQLFARQIQALGQEGDLLLVLSTSGNSDHLLHAVHAAHDRGLDVLVLSGPDGGVLANHLGPEDIELRVIGDTAARIRETHLFILHCFCDLIEQSLFGQL